MNLPRPLPEPPRELRFVVLGDPVPAQPAAIINGRMSRTGRGRVRAYKETVRLHTIMAVNAAKWGALRGDRFAVVLHVFVGDGRIIDCDNIAKNALDGMKTVAFPDDSQVWDLRIVKQIDRELPRMEIVVVREWREWK